MNIIDSGMNSIVSRNFAESASLNCFLKDTRFNCMVDPGAGCSLVTKGIETLKPVKLTSPDRVKGRFPKCNWTHR